LRVERLLAASFALHGHFVFMIINPPKVDLNKATTKTSVKCTYMPKNTCFFVRKPNLEENKLHFLVGQLSNLFLMSCFYGNKFVHQNTKKNVYIFIFEHYCLQITIQNTYLNPNQIEQNVQAFEKTNSVIMAAVTHGLSFNSSIFMNTFALLNLCTYCFCIHIVSQISQH